MKTFLRHRLLHAGLLAVASLARAQAPAGPIDLPTALRLAGADNIEVGIAREKVAEAKASGDAAKARYFPWITPAIVCAVTMPTSRRSTARSSMRTSSPSPPALL